MILGYGFFFFFGYKPIENSTKNLLRCYKIYILLSDHDVAVVWV
jgi:hypothetical protein